MTDPAAFDVEVKQAIYALVATTTRMPDAPTIASALRVPESDVLASFQRLHAHRLLVPEPGDPTRIRMAPPFSGVRTTFQVDCNGRRYAAPCSWDALGIPAALHAGAIITASDPDSGEPLTLEVGRDGPDPSTLIAHFAVPAAHWWDDIIHT